MTGIDIRGGNDGAPLEMTGDWTGYNNRATELVGLWIRNDGDYIREARDWAQLHGAREMAEYLIRILRLSGAYSAPGQTLRAVEPADDSDDPLSEQVDWAQIAYDLIGSDPEQKDLDAAEAWLVERDGPQHGHSEGQVWQLAAQQRAQRITRWVLEGKR